MAKPPSNPTGRGGFRDNPQNINRMGFTKEQRAAHYEQHNLALEIRAKQLEALKAAVTDGVPAEVLATIQPAINQLISDALDRWQGKATANMDITTGGESINKPTVIELVAPDNDDSAD